MVKKILGDIRNNSPSGVAEDSSMNGMTALTYDVTVDNLCLHPENPSNVQSERIIRIED